MRIFSPGARAWSTISVSGPEWAAHISPAAPAPRISVRYLAGPVMGADKHVQHAIARPQNTGANPPIALHLVSDPANGRQMRQQAVLP